MSFHFRSWLRSLIIRLWGKRSGPSSAALRRTGKRRCCGLRSYFAALQPQVAPVTGLTSFTVGANGIDMGQVTQTIAGATTLDLQAQHAGAGGAAIEPGDLVLITHARDSLSGSG